MTTISVVIPSFDRPNLLKRAVRSVLDQTRPAEQVLVIDNGTKRLKKEVLPDVVQVISAPVRAGASQARNIGAACATGTLLAFLDDDDEWHEEYLSGIEAAAKCYPTAGLFAGALYDLVTGEPVSGKNRSGPFGTWDMMRRNPGLVGSNLVIERKKFLRYGGFDPVLAASEDVDIVIRFVEAGEHVVRVQYAIAYYNSTHAGPRLSHFGVLMSGKRALARKHLRHWPVRAALLADYAARLLIARFRDART